MFVVGLLTAIAMTVVLIFLLYVRGIARFEGEPFLKTLRAITTQILSGEFF